jgi:hypothetical protein
MGWTRSSTTATFAAACLFICAPSLANSGGSPVCTVTTASMNIGMGARSGTNPNGWSLQTSSLTYSPGGSAFGVRVANSDPSFTFKGLLLWATDSSGNQVGTWAAPTTGFKRICSNRSLTQNSATPKSQPSAYFQLELPIQVRGQITIHASVVQSSRTTHYETISTHVHLDPLRNDLDIDTSVSVTKYHALTDGVLVMRFLLGLRGTPLTSGVKSAGAIRTDSEIETQLASLRDLGKLDVDSNGQTQPETDGLLVLRYLLGYRGDQLVAGANGGTLTAGQIEANIAALLP